MSYLDPNPTTTCWGYGSWVIEESRRLQRESYALWMWEDEVGEPLLTRPVDLET
jgi:hypothetical protein